MLKPQDMLQLVSQLKQYLWVTASEPAINNSILM